VDCCVTSPPYFGLRDYGVDGQIGAEKSPAEFVERLRVVFAEVRRVLADDGTLWLNLGDSYSSKTKGSGGTGKSGLMNDGREESQRLATADASNARAKFPVRSLLPGVPDKNLLGIPWRVAFALQDDGWILRNSIIWHKPNTMPSSVLDRCANSYEYVFLFAKSGRYWFDIDQIREQYADGTAERYAAGYKQQSATVAAQVKGSSLRDAALGVFGVNPQGRIPRDVWTIPTQPFPGAHFACFPPELARRCIVAGCKPGGTVLDPFSGSGTTGMVAQRNGRKYVGIDLNPEYLDLSLRTRLADQAMEFPA
jgi:DNA modification methylase